MPRREPKPTSKQMEPWPAIQATVLPDLRPQVDLLGPGLAAWAWGGFHLQAGLVVWALEVQDDGPGVQDAKRPGRDLVATPPQPAVRPQLPPEGLLVELVDSEPQEIHVGMMIHRIHQKSAPQKFSKMLYCRPLPLVFQVEPPITSTP